MVKPHEHGSQVFIVRLWLEPREQPGAQPVWRGMAERVPGGERRYFKDAAGLLDILESVVDELLDPEQPNRDPAEPDAQQPTGEHAQTAHARQPDDHSPLQDLVEALARLDRLLARAVDTARSVYGADAIQDPYRGLYISAGEVAMLLKREPATPLLPPDAEEQTPLPPTPSQVIPTRPGPFDWLGRWFAGTAAKPVEVPPPAAPTPEPIAEPVPIEPEPVDTGPLLPLVRDLDPGSPLAQLAQRYGLSDFDLDVLLVVLAPDLDLRYERLYAYLQDDVSRRRPGVDLVLNLLCSSVEEKALQRSTFSPSSALMSGGLLHLRPDRDDEQPPLLSHYVWPDGQVVRFLIGEHTLDPRLAPFAEWLPAGGSPVGPTEPPDDEYLLALLRDAWDNSRALRLYFQGEPGSGWRHKAKSLASDLDLPLLMVDLPRALAADQNLDWVPEVVLREAWLHNALVYLRGFDTLRSDDRAIALQQLWIALVGDTGITLLDGAQPWVPVGTEPGGVVALAIPVPAYGERQDQWSDLLAASGLHLPDEDLETLASRFRLTPGQIEDAFATALNMARWREAVRPDGDSNNAMPDLGDLFAAARAQTGHELAALARRVEPVYRWDDIVLPEDTLAQVREICQRVMHSSRVLDDWGFDRKLSQGKGTSVLFAGPSGTGKTMAAEILARELGLDLYKIDLSSVVSKYIGETEKNLERIFQAAENSNSILFFDEADALFGKRSEVRDSHDRYANVEISYLLQKMESYDGIAILATNLRQSLDEAFVRRMAFTVSFPFPDEASRLRIWKGIWPDDTPRKFTNADLSDLAARFKLSGGNIKNVALAAAYLAASEGKPVDMSHILRAVQREYQKMGKTLSHEELLGTSRELVA